MCRICITITNAMHSPTFVKPKVYTAKVVKMVSPPTATCTTKHLWLECLRLIDFCSFFITYFFKKKTCFEVCPPQLLHALTIFTGTCILKVFFYFMNEGYTIFKELTTFASCTFDLAHISYTCHNIWWFHLYRQRRNMYNGEEYYCFRDIFMHDYVSSRFLDFLYMKSQGLPTPTINSILECNWTKCHNYRDVKLSKKFYEGGILIGVKAFVCSSLFLSFFRFSIQGKITVILGNFAFFILF